MKIIRQKQALSLLLAVLLILFSFGGTTAVTFDEDVSSEDVCLGQESSIIEISKEDVQLKSEPEADAEFVTEPKPEPESSLPEAVNDSDDAYYFTQAKEITKEVTEEAAKVSAENPPEPTISNPPPAIAKPEKQRPGGSVLTYDGKVNDEKIHKGDVVTYTFNLLAGEKIEGIQIEMGYTGEVLQLISQLNTYPEEEYNIYDLSAAYPVLSSGGSLVSNANIDNRILFNAVSLKGYDFTNGGVLVTVSFNVIEQGDADIDLKIVVIQGKNTMYVNNGYITEQVPGSFEYGSSVTIEQSAESVPVTVTYNVSYSNNKPETQIKEPGVDLGLSTIIPKHSGYLVRYDPMGGTLSEYCSYVFADFKNWNTEPSGTGTFYNPGDTYTDDFSLNLYSQWKIVTLGELPVPERTGYTFKGWYVYTSGSVYASAEVTSSTVITENMILFANWVAEYDIDNPPAYEILPSAETVIPGETFTVDINANNFPKDICFGACFLYNQEIFELIDADYKYDDYSYDQSFFGYLELHFSTFCDQNLFSGTLATLTFKVKDTAEDGIYRMDVNHMYEYNNLNIVGLPIFEIIDTSALINVSDTAAE